VNAVASTSARLEARARRRSGVRLVRRAGWTLVLAVVAIVPLFPLYWMAIASLKTPEELQSTSPRWVPADPSLDAYRQVFDLLPFGRAFLNSTIIAGGSALAILVTSLMAGYVFAKYRFRGRDALFYLVIGTMFLPPIVMLVPLYSIVQQLGLTNTYAGVMLPNLANAFGIFLMRQFIAGVPDELIDAARVDGASEWRILWRIVTPLLKPALAVLGVFAIVYHWNNLLWPLTVLQSNDKFTLVLTLNRLVSYNTSVSYQNVVMAGAVISIMPTLVIFLLLQRSFVRGIAQTGLKG
jgi:multiple sugar transport system permease protein